MANETENANAVTIGNSISSLIAGALVEKALAFNFVKFENFSADSNVIKFRKSGSLVGETVNESAAYSFSSSSELTDTSVTVTGIKAAVASKITVEAQRFTGGQMNVARIAAEQATALGRAVDTAWLALFDGFSTQTTATNVLTADDVLESQYDVQAAMKGAHSGTSIGVFDYKGVWELRKELVASTATAFSNNVLLDLVGQPDPQSGFAGDLAGVKIYQSSGLPTANSAADDVGLVFDPEAAFCGGLGGTVQTVITEVGSGGFWTEVASYLFYDIKEFHDQAGSGVLSDT